MACMRLYQIYMHSKDIPYRAFLDLRQHTHLMRAEKSCDTVTLTITLCSRIPNSYIYVTHEYLVLKFQFRYYDRLSTVLILIRTMPLTMYLIDVPASCRHALALGLFSCLSRFSIFSSIATNLSSIDLPRSEPTKTLTHAKITRTLNP